jgi:hypothetical protein
MNLHFIGKEFERLGRLEDIINYQYEPKSNKRFGKRNIYFEDIKLDFINEVNTYGFSPFILKNFSEQREDPNIMRYMTKKFNHGLTNYVKLKTQAITRHTSQEIKKYISKKQKQYKHEKKKKMPKVISSIYLVKKYEEKKIDEVRENFLQKALQGMGGHKLNISIDEEENKEKDKDNKEDEDVDDNSVNEDETNNDKDHNIINNNDISSINETKKGMLKFDGKRKSIQKNKNRFPSIFKNNLELKKINENAGELDFDKILNDNTKKKVSFFNKNRNSIKSNIFTPQNINNKNNLELNLESIDSVRKKGRTNSLLRKFSTRKKLKKNEFLLFTKARPYRYMTSEAK